MLRLSSLKKLKNELKIEHPYFFTLENYFSAYFHTTAELYQHWMTLAQRVNKPEMINDETKAAAFSITKLSAKPAFFNVPQEVALVAKIAEAKMAVLFKQAQKKLK
jgi:hypothetical protein